MHLPTIKIDQKKLNLFVDSWSDCDLSYSLDKTILINSKANWNYHTNWSEIIDYLPKKL